MMNIKNDDWSVHCVKNLEIKFVNNNANNVCFLN